MLAHGPLLTNNLWSNPKELTGGEMFLNDIYSQYLILQIYLIKQIYTGLNSE